jgi:hypothetical protein
MGDVGFTTSAMVTWLCHFRGQIVKGGSMGLKLSEAASG